MQNLQYEDQDQFTLTPILSTITCDISETDTRLSPIICFWLQEIQKMHFQ